MRWDAKNLSQFLDTRKDVSPVWGWLQLVPSDAGTLWLACDSHNLAMFTTEAIPGLTEPSIVEDGKACLATIHAAAGDLVMVKLPNGLIIEESKGEEIESYAFRLRSRTDEDPQLDEWHHLATRQDRYKSQLLGLQADQFKLLGSMKDPKGKPATVVAGFHGPLWMVDFHLPQSEHKFKGVLAANLLCSQFAKADEA